MTNLNCGYFSILPGCYGNYPVTLLVYNSLTHSSNLTYISSVVYGGILLGTMKRLQNTSAGFKSVHATTHIPTNSDSFNLIVVLFVIWKCIVNCIVLRMGFAYAPMGEGWAECGVE